MRVEKVDVIAIGMTIMVRWMCGSVLFVKITVGCKLIKMRRGHRDFVA